MTSLIAWRNLAHDRARFVVTLVGIVFSVVLMGVQTGLLFGFADTTSGLVTRSGADLWIAPKGTKNVDRANLMGERKKYLALTVPGVARAESYLVSFARWKPADGTRETVILVGAEPNATMGRPWNVEAGGDLTLPDGVIVDRLYTGKLGVGAIEDTVEINDERARVVGFTHYVRTFTQAPYVFTSLAKAQTVLGVPGDRISYVLVKLEPGANPVAVRDALAARLPDNDVLTSVRFAGMSEIYWLFTTGAGVSLILSATLGLIVGIVIVAQTLYASTVDRLPEYATLRAMGAGRGYLYRIIVTQALLGAALGYGIGIAIVRAVVALSKESSAAPRLPLWLAAALGAITVVMCVGASLLSIRRVTKLDPVAVFR
jgi:putative ABC transport system permease protein